MPRIEGRNPVYEALKGKRRIHRVFIQNNISGDIIDKIIKLAEEKNVSISRISKNKLDESSTSHSHQGIMAEADFLPEYGLGDFFEEIEKKEKDPFVIILDEIKDPHNFGAIIRTAYAAGADAVIYQERRAADVTPIVLKSSAGAAEHIPLIKVTNINYTINDLKDNGFWIAGADVEAQQYHYDADLKGSIGIVIGSEGSGLRRLVKENCDFLIKIPMFSELGSLNASVAAGVIIYEVIRQRLKDNS